MARQKADGMNMSARERLEMALSFVDAGLACEPGNVAQLLIRAELLAAIGDAAAARNAYIAILRREPGHFAALGSLAALQFDTFYLNAAQALFAELAERYPAHPSGHAGLGRVALQQTEPERARQHFERALSLDPACEQAHQGLSAVLLESGDVAGSAHHRRLGFARHPVTTRPFRGDGDPIRLLLLASHMGGDLPWTALVDDRVFQTIIANPAFCDPAQPWPAHDLVFNAIGDADACKADLLAAEALLQHTTAPVINPPRMVLQATRDANARRLAAIPGVVTPRMMRVSRADVDEARMLGFPLLLRRPGFHTGRHFLRVETADDLKDAAAAIPGDDLLAIAFLNSADAHGAVRKYRVMLIDGELYPLHLAISAHWKVHYFSAEMAGNPARQAEERAFLNDMAGVLGPRVMQALRAVQATLALDYAGVDFGIGADGALHLYEANATMLIAPPDADPQWDYRRPAYQTALAAARHMLSRRVPGRLREYGGAMENTA
jgi:tetratricopeptide (TPR) repeat protein